MNHVVLLGDSIFDNASYVPGQSPVIEQLRQRLPKDWNASLLAVDGHITDDVAGQLDQLPQDGTHLVVSVGGNDALSESSVLAQPTRSVADALNLLRQVQMRFRGDYCKMLQAVCATKKPVTVCTIYDAIPRLGAPEVAALALFNEIILREAAREGLPVIDLRLVCDKAADYSSVSPIEPSMAGGSKITRVIAQVVTEHDFTRNRSAIYC